MANIIIMPVFKFPVSELQYQFHLYTNDINNVT